MSTPIPTQILDEIGLRLANITVANGYSVNVGKIRRAQLTAFKSDDLPAINYWPMENTKVGAGGGYEERRQSVFIECQTKTNDRPFTDVVEELATDIWVALCRADTAPAVTDNPSNALGDLVTTLSLEVVSPRIGEGQSPFCGVLLELAALYKRRPDAPFTIVK